MMNTDMDALECDLAETYQIYDYKELPLTKVALFSVGLRENSRIKMNKTNYSFETLLLAGILDRLSLMVWQNTKDAMEGKNMPNSILSCLMSIENHQNKNFMTFNSFEEFERMRKQILMEGG